MTTLYMIVRQDGAYNNYLDIMHHDGLEKGGAEQIVARILSRWTKPHGQTFFIHGYANRAERTALIREHNIQLL